MNTAKASDAGLLKVLSLGAGVQSTCLLLMSIEGILPKLDAAIFSDTGWEPREVYDHLDALEQVAQQAGIPIYRASRGSLPDDVLNRHKFATIPAWTPGGKIKRQCTPKYKIEPIERTLRLLLGAERWEQPCRYCASTGRRIAPWDSAAGEGPCSICDGTGIRIRVGSVPPDARAEQWIGFSADEFERVTTAGFPSYVTPRHPLIELGWTRNQCIRWMADLGWAGVTKSSCIGCPFHDDETWLEMKDHMRADDWQRLVEFDQQLRGADTGMVEPRYLNERRLPLDAAVEQYRRTKEDAGEQLLLWPEMKAKRRVRRCNPFGCSSEEVDE